MDSNKKVRAASQEGMKGQLSVCMQCNSEHNDKHVRYCTLMRVLIAEAKFSAYVTDTFVMKESMSLLVLAAQAQKVSAEAQKVSELQRLLYRSRQVGAEIHQKL